MGTETQLVKVKIYDIAANEASKWCRNAFGYGTWHEKIGFMRTGTVSFFFEFPADATLFRLRWVDVIAGDATPG